MAAMTDALFLVARPESLFKPSVMWRALRRGSPRPDRSRPPLPRSECFPSSECHVVTCLTAWHSNSSGEGQRREHGGSMAAGTTTFRPSASGPVPTTCSRPSAAPGSPPSRRCRRRSPCSTRSTGASPTPACASSSSTAATSCSAARAACPPASPLPPQPRVADDLPAGPLRHRLARLLDVRALLRLVEVTSQRTEADEAQRAGKGHRRGDRPPVTVDGRHRSGRPAPRRGDRVDRLPEAGRRAARSARGTRASSRSTAVLPTSPPTSAGVSPRWLRSVGGRPAGRRRRGDRRIPRRARQPPRRDGRQLGRDGGRHRPRVPPRPTRRRTPDASRARQRRVGCSPTTCASAPVRTSPGSAGSPGPPVTSTSTRSSGPTTRPTSMPPPPRHLVPLREHLGDERQAAHAELAAQLSSTRAAARGGGVERVARQSGRRRIARRSRPPKRWRRRSLGGSAGPTG